jgi:signal peptidase I
MSAGASTGSPDRGPLSRLPGVGTALTAARRVRTWTWRVRVAEPSMRPALEPGDWLLVDPTVRAWPRRGTIVVVREPGSDLLAIKRVAARPGDVIRTPDGPIRLGPSQAWLLGDDRLHSRDSRRYGPVGLDRLVARAWFRYGPEGRIGRLTPRR